MWLSKCAGKRTTTARKLRGHREDVPGGMVNISDKQWETDSPNRPAKGGCGASETGINKHRLPVKNKLYFKTKPTSNDRDVFTFNNEQYEQ